MPQSETTRHEILDAAERFLWDRPFREMTVAELMDPLSVGRSTFYIYFNDRYELAAELLDIIERKVLEASHAVPTNGPEPERLPTMLRELVQLWVRHGPLIRAISEASTQDQRLHALYRWGFIERMAERITAMVEKTDVPLDVAPEIGTLLALMVERYLCDGLGRHPQADPDQVTRTLIHAYEGVLSGNRRSSD